MININIVKNSIIYHGFHRQYYQNNRNFYKIKMINFHYDVLEENKSAYAKGIVDYIGSDCIMQYYIYNINYDIFETSRDTDKKISENLMNFLNKYIKID